MIKKNLILFFLFCSFSNFANVTLPKFFSDNMVLQRNKEIKIWGWSDKQELITVNLAEKTEKTVANEKGEWMIILPAMPAGGPYNIIIKGLNEIVISNVLIGDVWICSGQSNMEWVIAKFPFALDEVKNATYKNIRFLTVPREMSLTPLRDISGGNWKEAVSENIFDLSATAYFFGRYIYSNNQIPIGLISTSWGGTNIEAWTDNETLKKITDFKELMMEYDKIKTIELSDPSITTKKWINENLQKDIGLKNEWYKINTDLKEWKDIQVPSRFSEVGLKNFTGSVWYRNSFDLPIQFWDQPLSIKLGKVDDYISVWINETKIGENLGSDNWVGFEIPKEILKVQNNEIVVRIVNINNSEDGGFVSDADHLNFFRKGNQYGFVLIGGNWKYKKGSEMKSTQLPIINQKTISPNYYPSSLYNAMLNPFIQMSIKGIIWYQGESNANRAYQYQTLFPAMIQNWRSQFKQGDIPFLFVQLANFQDPVANPIESDWAELREAQNKALLLPNVGAAVTIDIGEAKNIHPSKKLEVGERLGLAAEKIAYEKNIVFSGPTFSSYKISGNKIIITFKNIGSGIVVKDKYNYLKEFIIAGEDKQFKWAQAFIVNDSTVEVSNRTILNPIAVRYAWANNPDEANLYNKEGLPASPFRTDNWDFSTKNNKYQLLKK